MNYTLVQFIPRPLHIFHQQKVDNIYLPHRYIPVMGVIDTSCEIDINIGSVTVFF